MASVMHNGFYLRAEKAGHPKEDIVDILEPSFTYACKDGFCIKGGMFLHGICDIFAEALHRKYGYELHQVNDEGNYLVHAFCTAKKNGKTVYVDVRGMTTDYEEFICPFDDFFPTEEERKRILPYDAKNLEYYESGYVKEALVAADKMLENNREYYELRFLHRQTKQKQKPAQEDVLAL